MEISDWVASVIAICSVVVAGSAAFIAWLQYRASLESGSIDFEFHHAWGPGTGDDRWIALTCRSTSAYVHDVSAPDGYAKAEFGEQLADRHATADSAPGLMAFGDVKFVRVHDVADKEGFYVDVHASVDSRGTKRTIGSPWIPYDRDPVRNRGPRD